MAKLSVTDVPVKGKRVLVRVDFNVPLDENLNISDESRILGALPTIKYLVENGAKTILCSHLGRPKGKVVPEMSLAPVAKRLAELLPNVKVAFASDSVGEDAKTKAEQLGEGEVLLLENLRFSKEEEKNDPEFAKALASLADVFVSDAFGTVHRAHASTEGVAHYLPAVCGFLIEKELSVMGGALANPARPFVSILGGKKVGDKIGVIRNLLDKCVIHSSRLWDLISAHPILMRKALKRRANCLGKQRPRACACSSPLTALLQRILHPMQSI